VPDAFDGRFGYSDVLTLPILEFFAVLFHFRVLDPDVGCALVVSKEESDKRASSIDIDYR
jgi:hypothetical protein